MPIKKYLLAGLLVWTPLAITVWVLTWLVGVMDGIFIDTLSKFRPLVSQDTVTSMRNMTGGSLPARTWREIMEYAHHGVELKNPYGINEQKRDSTPVASISGPGFAVLGRPQRPETLSRRSSETLTDIESIMRSSAARLKASDPGSTSSLGLGSSYVRLGPPGCATQ